ncbi:hypothetical protein AALP_AA8G376700 [Arabis alpina]|uniref:DUF3741 domain-containing protein n=1 Tax=Arabis alpina TaxID=50452 RepID=A0A087GBY8_ARAAL|nr:hypothetical protein AALP_AA8G376700 [Arabis alpina]
MKSSSSSSSLCFTSKTHTFGCISLILQRFLCSGTSSTYPSDQITEPVFESPDFCSEPPGDRGDELGAVARLMGLDSIPVKTRVVSRSRSVSSLDYVDDEIQRKHRRVKSTVELYQFPEYVELEDDRFFILSFEKDRNEKGFGELKHLGTNQSETENQTRIEAKENNIRLERLEVGELKQRRKEKRQSRRKRREIKLRQNIEKDNLIKRFSHWSRDGDSLTNCEVRSTNEEEEEECGSCNDSSPVSVLDYDRFAGVPVTPERVNSSRRRLSSELESSKRNETIQEDQISRESKVRLHDYQEMWLMICRLNVSEIKESKWVSGKASNRQDWEGLITEDIVSNILDQLLEETITTLSLT